MNPTTSEIEKDHEPEAIRRRLEARKKVSYLGDAVLGAVKCMIGDLGEFPTPETS